MTEKFVEIARTDTYSLMAELESQSLCPRLGDCEIVRQYGIKGCCDDFSSYCPERDKEIKSN